jgi:hypothetical protein
MAKSRILLLSLALLLLAPWAAGPGGFVSPAGASEGASEGGGEKAEKPDDKTAKDKLRAMFGGDLIQHLPLPIFSIPVIRDNEVTDQVNIAIVVETKSDENRDKVIAGRFKLYDAFLRDLYGLLAIKRADGQLLDQQVVKIRLARVSDKLLGPGVINSILVSGVSQRPLNQAGAQ